MKGTSWSQGLSVTADGEGLVPLAGAVAVRLLADRVGLTAGLSTALARRGFVPGHVRGQVWVDVATMLTAGGEAIADIDTLRHQGDLLGPVASAPTVWRTLDEATPARLERVEKARAFFNEHKVEGTERAMARVTEQVNECAALRAREMTAVAEYLTRENR